MKKQGSTQTTATTGAASAEQPTDDVIVDQPATSDTVGDDGTVDEAQAGAQPLPVQPVKDTFTAATNTMAQTMDGGAPGLAKDTGGYLRAFKTMGQSVSLFVGYHTFMTAVTRPQNAALVPAAATALKENWSVLMRLVPGALADVSISTIAALLLRLNFVKALVLSVGQLNQRLMALQSHLEDQLATQMRPVYTRCLALLTSHDDLVGPMEALVQLFSAGGQKAAQMRRNNQKVVAANGSNKAPGAPETGPATGTTTPAGTTGEPGTGTVGIPVGPPAAPVKTPAQPAARKRGRVRG